MTNQAQQSVGRGNLGQTRIDKLYEYGVPSHMHGGIIRYVEEGIPPGDFLSAVINNDLKQACARADDTNKNRLHTFVMWFYNQAPSACWGHKDAVLNWCAPIEEEA